MNWMMPSVNEVDKRDAGDADGQAEADVEDGVEDGVRGTPSP